jgi:hypothetical protein
MLDPEPNPDPLRQKIPAFPIPVPQHWVPERCSQKLVQSLVPVLQLMKTSIIDYVLSGHRLLSLGPRKQTGSSAQQTATSRQRAGRQTPETLAGKEVGPGSEDQRRRRRR